LERSLIHAEPEGYVRVFLDEGIHMVNLLRQIPPESDSFRYAGILLDTFNAGSQPGGQHIDQTLDEQLSKREIEVLKLVAAGLSNQEIAIQLSISLSTINTHTNNIYQKLNVRNRTQAVNQAKERKII
jgi:LuxR family maltose regulon positive regulatory protein